MKISKDLKIKAMKAALESAKVWFSNFGFNVYGVVVADDVEDHTEILEEIKAALEIEKKKDR